MLGFHDGFLDGFWTPGDGSVHVFLRDQNKNNPTTVLLSGVRMMRAGEFKAATIILSLAIRECSDISLEDINFVYEADPERPHQQVPDELMQKHEEQNRRLLCQSREAGLRLFEIASSYGGYLVALAQEIEFLSRSAWIPAASRWSQAAELGPSIKARNRRTAPCYPKKDFKPTWEARASYACLSRLDQSKT